MQFCVRRTFSSRERSADECRSVEHDRCSDCCFAKEDVVPQMTERIRI